MGQGLGYRVSHLGHHYPVEPYVSQLRPVSVNDLQDELFSLSDLSFVKELLEVFVKTGAIKFDPDGMHSLSRWVEISWAHALVKRELHRAADVGITYARPLNDMQVQAIYMYNPISFELVPAFTECDLAYPFGPPPEDTGSSVLAQRLAALVHGNDVLRSQLENMHCKSQPCHRYIKNQPTTVCGFPLLTLLHSIAPTSVVFKQLYTLEMGMPAVSMVDNEPKKDGSWVEESRRYPLRQKDKESAEVTAPHGAGKLKRATKRRHVTHGTVTAPPKKLFLRRAVLAGPEAAAQLAAEARTSIQEFSTAAPMAVMSL